MLDLLHQEKNVVCRGGEKVPTLKKNQKSGMGQPPEKEEE